MYSTKPHSQGSVTTSRSTTSRNQRGIHTITYANDVVIYSSRNRRRSHVHRPPLFAAPPIQYPQLIKDPALGQYIPFLAKVPPHDHHQEETQVIDLIAKNHDPDYLIPVVTCTLTYLVHLEIPLPRVTDIREDIILHMP